jgi:GNAT superfamily N-acetyltransferase
VTPLPATLTLAGRAIAFREATVEDAPAIARTEVDSKRASIPGFASGVELDYDARLDRWVHYLNRTRSPRLAKDPRIVLLASDGMAVVGYAACHETTKWGVAAELQSIYLLQEYQGAGIGTALFCLIVEWMQCAGLRSLGVGIAAGNPYQRFYQKLGGTPLDEHTYLWREWDRLAERCAERARAIGLSTELGE